MRSACESTTLEEAPISKKAHLRADQAEATRAALVQAARRLFAAQGYHATGTHDVVAHAGVTRGALYHHFPDKESLFLAVFHDVEISLINPSDQASTGAAGPGRGGDAWSQFAARLQGFLTAVLEPEAQRILLIDGPAVLGWDKWRELESHYGLGMLTFALENAMQSGIIRRQPPRPLAHLLLAALEEAALLIAHAPDPVSTRIEVGKTLDSLMEGLRPGRSPKGPSRTETKPPARHERTARA
jgi:AcrR family transcriptional regulator